MHGSSSELSSCLAGLVNRWLAAGGRGQARITPAPGPAHTCDSRPPAACASFSLNLAMPKSMILNCSSARSAAAPGQQQRQVSAQGGKQTRGTAAGWLGWETQPCGLRRMALLPQLACASAAAAGSCRPARTHLYVRPQRQPAAICVAGVAWPHRHLRPRPGPARHLLPGPAAAQRTQGGSTLIAWETCHACQKEDHTILACWKRERVRARQPG